MSKIAMIGRGLVKHVFVGSGAYLTKAHSADASGQAFLHKKLRGDREI